MPRRDGTLKQRGKRGHPAARHPTRFKLFKDGRLVAKPPKGGPRPKA